MHLILIEDDEADVAAVSNLVRSQPRIGPLTIFHNGLTAQRALAGALGDQLRYDPHLILLDLTLPGLDGLSLLRWLRGQPYLRRSPVFVLTSSDAAADMQAAYAACVAGYVVKGAAGERLARLGPLLDVYAQAVTLPQDDPFRRYYTR